MKNKELERKRKSYSQLATKTVLLLIFSFTVLFALSLSISASAEIRDENYNLCEKYLQKLSKEISYYSSLDTSPEKTVSASTEEVINAYKNEIKALQTHKDIDARNLESEILLSFTKGSASGKLAWIYHDSIYRFDSEISNELISAKYNACKSSVESATSYTALEADIGALVSELNRYVYSERIQALSLPTDTLTSKALITGAQEEIKFLTDTDIAGVKFEESYQKLLKALSLQRARDTLLTEVKDAFVYIRPQENISNSADFALFAYNLEKSVTITDMNACALSCITSFISPDPDKPYSNSAKKQYISAAATAVSKASELNAPAKFEGVFDTYPLSDKKSMIKDSIYALFLGDGSSGNGALKELESEFNGAGGRIDACASISETETEFTNAKAQLFLQKHSAIYKKALESITKEDEVLAKNAIIAYTELEPETKAALLTEINIIAEKYNFSLSKKISDMLADDLLYQSLCKDIINELKTIPRDNIDVFYNKTSKIPEKAYALSEVIAEYRAILSSEHQTDFTDSEIAEFASAIDEFSNDLSTISTTDPGTYADEINDAKTSALRKLNITNQCARVRISAGKSTNPAIAEEITLGYDKIKICTSKGEMTAQANRAIFKIQRHLTSDEITKRIKNAKEKISSLGFITEEESSGILQTVDSLSSFAEEAKIAESSAYLETIWKKFLADFDTAINKANAIDLSRAISAHLEKISSDAKKAEEALRALQFISQEESDEIYNLIIEQKESATASVSDCKSSDEVISAYESFVKELEKTLTSANDADLEGYKTHLLSEFDKYEQIKSNYSEENYNKILDIQAKATEDIQLLKTKEECRALIDTAHLDISKINDLLQDAKDEALLSLSDFLADAKNNSILYSAENLTKLEAYCNEGASRIEAITDIANISSVKETLLHYLTLLKGVNKDFIYTSKDAYAITSQNVQYPQGYNISLGLWASIKKSDSLISDAVLEAKAINVSNENDILEAIQKSAKKGTLKSRSQLSKETLKLLSSSKILMSLDVSLSKTNENESGYYLKLLLPQSMSKENILGIAIVNSDNSVEFITVERVNSLLSLNIDNLTRIYIVAEGTLNVKPLLIFLIFLLIAEFIVLAAIIYLRRKRKKGKGDDPMSNLPVAGFIPASAALTKIYPQNGILLSIFLSISALALGIAIVLLIKKEAEPKKDKNQKLIQGRERKELPEGKNSNLRLKAPEENQNTQEKIFCTVGGNNNQDKKNYNAEIDLDTIAKNFDSGETVNIETLKYKGLVDKDAKSVKILAKGRLTKPLRVEANEFSTAAKKILELSGGEAKEIK